MLLHEWIYRRPIPLVVQRSLIGCQVKERISTFYGTDNYLSYIHRCEDAMQLGTIILRLSH